MTDRLGSCSARCLSPARFHPCQRVARRTGHCSSVIAIYAADSIARSPHCHRRALRYAERKHTADGLFPILEHFTWTISAAKRRISFRFSISREIVASGSEAAQVVPPCGCVRAEIPAPGSAASTLSPQNSNSRVKTVQTGHDAPASAAASSVISANALNRQWLRRKFNRQIGSSPSRPYLIWAGIFDRSAPGNREKPMFHMVSSGLHPLAQRLPPELARCICRRPPARSDGVPICNLLVRRRTSNNLSAE